MQVFSKGRYINKFTKFVAIFFGFNQIKNAVLALTRMSVLMKLDPKKINQDYKFICMPFIYNKVDKMFLARF
jgi:hypothetical protein